MNNLSTFNMFTSRQIY